MAGSLAYDLLFEELWIWNHFGGKRLATIGWMDFKYINKLSKKTGAQCRTVMSETIICQATRSSILSRSSLVNFTSPPASQVLFRSASDMPRTSRRFRSCDMTSSRVGRGRVVFWALDELEGLTSSGLGSNSRRISFKAPVAAGGSGCDTVWSGRAGEGPPAPSGTCMARSGEVCVNPLGGTNSSPFHLSLLSVGLSLGAEPCRVAADAAGCSKMLEFETNATTI